jgi:hypothetical protein
MLRHLHEPLVLLAAAVLLKCACQGSVLVRHTRAVRRCSASARIGIVFANICCRDASQAAQRAATARCGSGCVLGLLARLPGAAEGKHLGQPELVKGAVTVLHQLSGRSLDSMWVLCFLLLRFVRVWQGSCCCSCVVVAVVFSVAVCLYKWMI